METREDLIRSTCPFKPVTNLSQKSFQKSRYNASPVSVKSKTSQYTGVSNISRSSRPQPKENNEKSIRGTPRREGQGKIQGEINLIGKNIKKANCSKVGGDSDIFLVGKDGNLKNFEADAKLFEDFSDTSHSPSRYGLTENQNRESLQNLDPIRILASQLHAQNISQKNMNSLDERCFRDLGPHVNNSNTNIPKYQSTMAHFQNLNLPMGVPLKAHNHPKPQVFNSSKFELQQFKMQEQVYRPSSRISRPTSANLPNPKQKIQKIQKKQPKRANFAQNDKENFEENIFHIEDMFEKAPEKRTVSRTRVNPKGAEKIKCVVKKSGAMAIGKIKGSQNVVDNRDSFVYAKDKGCNDFVSTSMSNYASSGVGSKRTPNNLLLRLNHVFK